MVSGAEGWRVPIAHRAPIQAVAGGRGLIVTAGGGGTIRSWAAVSGQPAGLAVSATKGRFTFLDVVEVGATAMVVCADGTALRRFDAESGREVGEPLRSPQAWLPSGGLGVVASATGKGRPLVVAETTGSLTCWDLESGEPFPPLWTEPLGRLLAMTAWHRDDGRTVAATSNNDGVVRLWDVTTGQPVGRPFQGHRRPVTALLRITGPDGREHLAGQEFRGPILRWDAIGGELLGMLPGESEGLNEGGLATDPDGRVLFAVDQAGLLRRWDLAAAEPVAETVLIGDSDITAPVVVSSDAGPLCVVGDGRGRVRRWDLSGRAVGDEVPGHPSGVQALIAVPAGGPSGRTVLVSAGRDGTRCWDAATGEPVGVTPAPAPVGNGLAAAWLPDGRLIAAVGRDEGLARFDALSDDEESTVGDRVVWTVASGTQPDGRPFFAGGTVNGRVQLIDAETGEAWRPPLRVSKSQVLAVAATTLGDGTVLLATGGEDRQVVRWNAVTGDRIGTAFDVGEYWVMELSFRALPDGRILLISVDDDGARRRWDAVTGQPIADDDAPEPPGVPAVLPDGRAVLAVGGPDGSLTVTMAG